MKAAAVILGSALLAISFTPATAGPCTGAVDDLTKALSGQATSMSSSPTLQEYQANLNSGADQAAPAISAANEDATVPPGRSRETTGSSMPMPAADPKPERAASETIDIAQAHSMAGATNALEQARLFDQQGRETDCLRSVGMAKLISGFR